MKRRLFGVGRTGLGATSATIALLMPKCPMCVAAGAWAFGALGLDFAVYERIKWPLLLTLMGVGMLTIASLLKPWAMALLSIASVVGLILKMRADDEFSVPVLIGWIVTAALCLGVSAWSRQKRCACAAAPASV